ncbi:MAG TPA: hypothetical protein VFP42_13275 [Acidimicrobiia bacterium]|nr:hypothetical protein [Acidimicrobiia bacterium]
MPESLGRDSLSPSDLANQVARHIAETAAPSTSSWLRDSVLLGRLISGTVLAGMVAVLVGGTYFGVNWLAGRAPAAAVDVLSLEVASDSSPDGDTTTIVQEVSGVAEVTTAPAPPFAAEFPGTLLGPSDPPGTTGATIPLTEIPRLPPPPPVVAPTMPSIPAPPSTTPTTSPAVTPTSGGGPGTTTTVATTTSSEPASTTTTVEATTTTCRGNSGGGTGIGPCGP